MTSGIIVAGGKSERMGPNVDKTFLSLGAKPVLVYSMLAFEKCADVDEVVLVVRKERIETARCAAQMFGCKKITRIVAGGNQRQQSVLQGLKDIHAESELVVVHDGARPCVTPELISETLKSARLYGSGVAAVKVTDTVKEVEKGTVISRTVDRTMLWQVQTPQAFRVDLLRKAFEVVVRKKIKITDEAAAVECISTDVRLVAAFPGNIKITTPDDLVLAAALMRL